MKNQMTEERKQKKEGKQQQRKIEMSATARVVVGRDVDQYVSILD